MTENTAAAQTATTCRCSVLCGRPTTRLFAQGHDARMVSLLVREVVDGAQTVDEARLAIRRAGGTENLVAKFDRAVANAAAKAQAKADRKAAKQSKPAKVAEVQEPEAPKVVTGKVGRWTYEGVVTDSPTQGQQFTYTDKKGVTQTTTKFTLV